MSLLHAENISRVFSNTGQGLRVLSDVNIRIEQGEMTAIIGASGSGKTTLLQILGTLDRPTEGALYFNGKSLLDRSAAELCRFRNRSIGFIFQFHHLLPDFTAVENVMMPALINGESKRSAQRRAEGLLEEVELSKRLDHKVSELSGGEQQRTALARALIMDPALLLADEPTGNLDARSGDIVFSMLHRLCKERALSTIMVTHNNELASRMDHCLVLKEGTLVEADIFSGTESGAFN